MNTESKLHFVLKNPFTRRVNHFFTGNCGKPLILQRKVEFTSFSNCGWISLSNTFAHVQTTTIQPAPLVSNGPPIAWLLQNYGTTNMSATIDSDGDGVANGDEYQAGTNPNDTNSVLRITSFTRQVAPLTYTTLLWNSVPTRFYAIQYRTNLAAGIWQDWVVFPYAGANNAGFNDPSEQDFFRIRAFRPLMS